MFYLLELFVYCFWSVSSYFSSFSKNSKPDLKSTRNKVTNLILHGLPVVEMYTVQRGNQNGGQESSEMSISAGQESFEANKNFALDVYGNLETTIKIFEFQ